MTGTGDDGARTDHLHVVHVLMSLDIGGMERGVLTLLERLDRRRFRQTLVCLADVHPRLAPRLEASGAAWHALHKDPWSRDAAVLWRLWRLLRRLRPDIVHSRNYPAIDAPVVARFACRARTLHGEHGRRFDEISGLARRALLRRRLARRFTDHYVALGEHLRDSLIGEIGVDPRRITVLYNGVDCRRFRPPVDERERQDARLALLRAAGIAEERARAIAAERLIVASSGRLDPVKDHLSLVRAVALLPEEWRRRVQIVLVGDGPHRPAVEREARDLGLAGRLALTGFVVDPAPLYRGFDLFVLPSLFEGLSNALLEAMASGVAIVATEVGGTPELVSPGVSADLVPAGDARALSRAVGALLADPARRAMLGAHARREAERRFSIEAMCAGHAALYERLAAGTVRW